MSSKDGVTAGAAAVSVLAHLGAVAEAHLKYG